MESIQMRYKGCTLNVNPEKISMRLSKKLSSTVIPFKKTKTQEVCHNPCVISGSGVLTGAEAQQQAYALLRCYRSKGADYLFSPYLPPLRMHFTALHFHAGADMESIYYSFEFKEEPSGKQLTRANRYTLVRAGENLFDIANRTGYPVEYLAEHNNFRNLFALQEGDTVWLR